MAEVPEWPVRVSALEEAQLGPGKIRYTVVRFTVERPGLPFEVPIGVKKGTDDANLIPLARNYLHRTFRLLADQTANWELSEEDVAALLPATKTP